MEPTVQQQRAVLRLYSFHDKQKSRILREIPLAQLDAANRNSKLRLFAWSADPDEMNYYLYPEFGTAYPEFENRLQEQRPGKRFRYDLLEA
jgi:hypothetical protein